MARIDREAVRCRALTLAVAAVVIAGALLAGCGSGGSSTSADGDVVISAAAPPTGDPALDTGRGDTHIQDRVAVTPQGKPTAVYALKMTGLTAGTWVGGRGSLTVTKCAHTDYDPTARSTTGCQHTKHYHFDPVRVTAQLKLVPDDKGKPDLSAEGVALSQPQTLNCTTAEHHCVPTAFGEAQLSASDAPGSGEDMWLVFSLEASSPKAAPCTPGTKAAKCDVLAVEAQKHTAMYGGIAHGGTPEGQTLPRDVTVDATKLPTVDDNAPRASARRVVYSVELAPKGGIQGLVGDQLRVLGQFAVNESEKLAPLVSGYLVLADSPTSTSGRYLSSDTYDANRTGDTGENCTGKCTYVKPAAATPITKCDVKSGRRYVNLVADSVRDAAKPGESVQVASDGGFLEVLQYPGTTEVTRSDCKGG